MDKLMGLSEFLAAHKISEEDFLSTGICWDELNKISEDHDKNRQSLNSVAEYCAKIAHLHPKVHSIRWRIKDSDHLKAKIIRKNIEKNPKYKDISIKNYKEIITDLVGIRILHLYKDDFSELLENLKSNWHQIEDPVAYIRNGDNTEIYEKCGLETKIHVAGYRSVHYIFSSSPSKNTVVVEAQIRTVFEEGWSEIDHKLRYPNYQPSHLTEYFLKIFNRLAGSADEMGAFVNHLENDIREKQKIISSAEIQREQSQKEIDSLIVKLEAAKGMTQEQKEIIKSLKSQINSQPISVIDPYSDILHNYHKFENNFDNHEKNLRNALKIISNLKP